MECCTAAYGNPTLLPFLRELTQPISRRAFRVRSHFPEIAIRPRRPAPPYPAKDLPSVLPIRLRAFDWPFEGCPIPYHAFCAGYEGTTNARDSTACSFADLVPQSQNANLGATGIARRSGTDELAG